MKCAHHDEDEADEGVDPAHAILAPVLHGAILSLPLPPHPPAGTNVLLQVLPSLSLSTRLSSCRCVFPRCPLPAACCLHVLLLLLRLFALKILFIAIIARICTKISYNAGQQHRDGKGIKRIMK